MYCWFYSLRWLQRPYLAVKFAKKPPLTWKKITLRIIVWILPFAPSLWSCASEQRLLSKASYRHCCRWSLAGPLWTGQSSQQIFQAWKALFTLAFWHEIVPQAHQGLTWAESSVLEFGFGASRLEQLKKRCKLYWRKLGASLLCQLLRFDTLWCCSQALFEWDILAIWNRLTWAYRS